ncbi:MAG TPA: lipase maturation factor family protein, partial [Anaerolineae bacterium]|nr:lipase maturation factor family protein [Anaerolineae bacterium]
MSDEPVRPVMIYDGECTFCRTWIEYWQRLTGDRVEYAPFQIAADRFPHIPRSAFESAVHLMWPDGRVTFGAQAVFETLALTPGHTGWLRMYRHAPGFAPLSEASYRFIATHRDFFYWVTRVLWGKRLQPATFDLTRWLFLKLLGVVYFFAFFSFALQATGLIGSHGIVPVGDFLQEVLTQLGARSYALVPTIFWFNASDAFLQIVAWAGVVLSVVLIAGWARRVVIVLLFIGYLSIVNAGQVFMSFQWDVLLVEAGFLAIFIDFGVTIWLYRLLLFRLMFLSGAGKLLSGDPTWHDLTALNYHFATQPLPTVFGWWMHQLPNAMHRLFTLVTF